MPLQTFACPACGSRKTFADAQPGEKVHCTCGMSYPASPVFEVHEAAKKSSGIRWALIVAVSVLVGSGVSAAWLAVRPKPPRPAGGEMAKNPALPESQSSRPTQAGTTEPPDSPSNDTPPTKGPETIPPAESHPAPPPPPPPPRPPVASLSAVTLWDAFDLDPPAAQAKFGGQVVEISARGKLAEDSLGRAYFGAVVVRQGGRKPRRLSPEEQQWETDGYPASIRCYITTEQAAALEKVPADRDVVIRGTCTGRKDIDGVYRGYIVELADCTIVGPK